MAPKYIEDQLSPSELVIVDPVRYLLVMDRLPPDPNRFKHNWRLDMLAVPKGRKEEVELFSVSPKDRDKYLENKNREKVRQELIAKDKPKYLKVINRLVNDTVKELGLLPPRFYAQQKKTFKTISPKKCVTNWDKCKTRAINSHYREYVGAKIKYKKELKKKAPAAKGKGAKTPKPTKSKSKKKIPLSEVIAYVSELAKPKVPPEPPEISRGKTGDVDEETLEQLAEPKFYTPRYVNTYELTWRTQHYVPMTALSYNMSNRMYVLAMPKVTHGEPPKELYSVEPNALTARATPRILELAIPKARSAKTDSDYNEDAFKVSPNAMKYKASERIIELAKPVERS